jgi:hypothetical protein
MPTDEDVLAYIKANDTKGVRLSEICDAFGIGLIDMFSPKYEYSRGAKNIANMLQRLRKAQKIRSNSAQRWIIKQKGVTRP